MAHEDARNGIGKVFTAQILLIITAICYAIAAICTAVAIGAAASDAMVGAGISTILLVLFGLAGGVMSIIGFILQLVGLSKAGKDNDKIKSAFTITIIGLIIAIVIGIVKSLVGASYAWAGNIGDLVNFIISLIVTYNVLMGCAELNPALQEKAEKTWKMYMIVVILDIVIAIVAIIMGILGVTAVSAVASYILIILDVVFEVVSFVMYLMFLAQARNEV